MDHFETMHTCCGYIEDVHRTFSKQGINLFEKSYGILGDFQVRLQYGEKVCVINFSQFSSNQFETLHRCYKHTENVHETSSRQENNF